MPTQDMTVKARYEADVRGYQASMQAAAASTEKLAQAADRAGKATETASQAAEKAASRVAAAQEKATRAQERAADAAGRLRVAQTALESARDAGNVQALVTAEERVAKAQRDVEAAARQAATAHQEYQRAVADAADASRRLGDQMEATGGKTSRVFDGLRRNSADLQEVGSGLATVGAAMTAAAGGATKAAMDWETAFTGVKKTVDGSDQQYADLEKELRGLATTLPTMHKEIAAVAEAAGQLGVSRGDISGFTKVMIDLGESTNLTAEDAATQIAQISNVMGTMKRDGVEGVQRFGGALVALGNAGASTEADILAMSQRISGVGATVGATEADVLALANTLSSMGVKAELGGGVTTRVLLKMKAGVESGGKALDAFAKTAGVSADEFAARFKASPMEALNLVAQGINRVNKEGGATTQTLKDMGMKGTEEAQVMLALANSGTLLADSLKLGKEAWDANTASNALATEANKRYATSASQVKIAWNQIQDAAIDAGAAVLPVLADLMGGVADMVRTFQGLPGPVKGALGALAAIGGVALTAGGGFMMLAPKALEAVDAFRRLTGAGPQAAAALDGVDTAAGRTHGTLGKLTRAAGIAAGVLVGWEVLKGFANDSVPAAHGLEEVANALLKVKESSNFTPLNNLFNTTGDVKNFGDALRYLDPSDLDSKMESFGETVLGLRTSTAQAREQMSQLDKVLASMSPQDAAAQFQRLREEAERSGSQQLSSWEGLKKVLPEYAAQVEAASNATGKSADAATLYGIAMGHLPAHMQAAAGAADQLGQAMSGAQAPTGGVSDALGALEGLDTTGMDGIATAMGVLADESKEADEKLDGVLDALFGMGLAQQSAAEATAGYAAAVSEMADALEKNGQTLDINTKAGRENQQALFGIADAGRNLVKANAEAGASQGELRDNLAKTYADLVAAAGQFGATGDQAKDLAKTILGIPAGVSVDTYLDNAAMVAAEATTGAIKAIPGYKGVAIVVSDQGTTGTVQSQIDAITGAERFVFVDDQGTTHQVQQRIENIAGVERTVWVGDDGTVYATQAEIDAVAGHHVEIKAVPTGISETEAALNWLSRTRFTEVQVDYVTRSNFNPYQNGSVDWSKGAFPGLKDGGVASLPGYSSGGMLPRTGLGTDMILGVTGDGRPIARVDDGEWIINAEASREFNGVLHAINRRDPRVAPLKGYAGGGVPGREWSGRPAIPVVNVTAPGGPGIDPAAIAAAAEAGVLSGVSKVRFQLGIRDVAALVADAAAHTRGR